MERDQLQVCLELGLQVQFYQLVGKQLIDLGIDGAYRVERVDCQVLSPDEIVLVVLDSEAVLDEEEAVRSFPISNVELLVLLDRVVAILQLQAKEDFFIVQVPHLFVFLIIVFDFIKLH